MKTFTKSFLIILFIFYAPVVFSKPITLKNWKYHYKIKEIRKIVKSVNNEIKNKSFNHVAYKYDINSKACKTSYPVISMEFAEDEKGRLRFFRLFRKLPEYKTSTEVFFDSTGIARFVFVKSAVGSDRYYYDSYGDYLWGVEEYPASNFKSIDYEYEIQTNLSSIKESIIRKDYITKQYTCPKLPNMELGSKK